ncbi:harmonin-like [Paramacrobiotus metropolitanus]|uniref:harmonin-like n=1 Tax=Paramacrobiotus metropolitanus TaxID=2943436 RepID=UPI002445CFA7|nr:harmonin-like [Paramacrobiotus metropolitanus]
MEKTLPIDSSLPNTNTDYDIEFDLAVYKLYPQLSTRTYLRKVIRQYSIGFITAAMFARRLTELVTDPFHLELFDVCRKLVRIADQIEFSQTLPMYDLDRVLRRIVNRKTLNDEFGFRVCGGRDQNCPLVISNVDRKSRAWRAGVRPGMQICRVNGMRVNKATHRIFVDYVKISLQLDLEMKMVGMIPKQTKSRRKRWEFPVWGEMIDNKLPIAMGRSVVSFVVWSNAYCAKELRILIPDTGDATLGLHVRQSEAGLQVLAVQENSTAWHAKIRTGDVIVESNGKRLEQRDLEESLAFLNCEGSFLMKIMREFY